MKGNIVMKDFEQFLQKSYEVKNEHGYVNYMKINLQDRNIVEYLKLSGLIANIRYLGMNAVGFDLTYKGLHYFD